MPALPAMMTAAALILLLLVSGADAAKYKWVVSIDAAVAPQSLGGWLLPSCSQSKDSGGETGLGTDPPGVGGSRVRGEGRRGGPRPA